MCEHAAEYIKSLSLGNLECLIDYMVFYAVSAICRLYNDGHGNIRDMKALTYFNSLSDNE